MRTRTNSSKRKTKVALLLNMIAPARLGLYSFLADQFDLLILHGGTEANRDSWHDMDKKLPNARVVRAWGWQIQYGKKVSGVVFDQKFIHITPGFAWHLLCFRPDAIITNEMGLRTMIALLYGSLIGKPVWVWWGGTLHTERSLGTLRKIARRVVAGWAKHWISYGQTSTAYLLSLGIGRDRILESQNAIDETRFVVDVPPAWNIQPRPVVLHVGQFIERKGIGFLLDAVASVQKQGYEFSLLLVGSGRDRAAIEERSKGLGLKNVHFQSSQTPDKMPSAYRSADVLVFPTREDVWGLVANEAILSGLPVLCSKYAGCAPELFEPDNMFAPEDPLEFAEKLKAAIAGQLPKADVTRLKTTEQLGSAIVDEVKRFLSGIGNSRLRDIPSSSLDPKLESRNESTL